jgi:hypothetical protein
MRPMPTAPFAAATFLASWAAVEASGSRALGGAVLLAGALALAVVWRARHGGAVAGRLLAVGLLAFVLSHALGLLVGAWPAVIVTAGAMGWVTWRLADSRRRDYDAGGGDVASVEPGPYRA